MARKKISNHEIAFTAPLERFTNRLTAFYVAVPYSVEDLFGTKGSVRMLGTINGIEVDRALIPTGDGTHHILVPTEMRNKAKLRLGDAVHVVLRKNENPDDVEIPEELIAALELEPEIYSRFHKLSPSVKRGMAMWINSGKKVETRIQRVLEILKRFQQGKLVFGGKIVKED
jgi:hypothetical protein